MIVRILWGFLLFGILTGFVSCDYFQCSREENLSGKPKTTTAITVSGRSSLL